MKGGSRRPTNFSYINTNDDNAESPSTGGIIVPMLAAAALKIGDAVYLSAADTVNKSGVVADYQKTVGIVVGGFCTNMEILQDDNAIGVVEATKAAGQLVLVCIHGIAKSLSEAATAAGVRVTAGVTPGRISAVGIAAGNSIGMTTSATAGVGQAQKVLINRA